MWTLEWCKEWLHICFSAWVLIFCNNIYCVREREQLSVGVVWCCRPSWLPVVIVHQQDQGWGMLPWDYPMRVTWSACNAFKSHVFVSWCVCLCVLSMVCECIPDLHLNSDPSMNCLWSSSVSFLFHFPSMLPLNQQISEENHTSPLGASLVVSLSLS